MIDLPNISIAIVLRALWTVFGLIGSPLTAVATWECLKDLRALRHRPDMYIPGGAREIVARQNLRNMTDRLFFMVVYTIVGVVALLSPAPKVPTVYTYVISAGFLIAEIRMVLAARLDMRDRTNLLRLVRERRRDRDSRNRTTDLGDSITLTSIALPTPAVEEEQAHP